MDSVYRAENNLNLIKHLEDNENVKQFDHSKESAETVAFEDIKRRRAKANELSRDLPDGEEALISDDTAVCKERLGETRDRNAVSISVSDGERESAASKSSSNEGEALAIDDWNTEKTTDVLHNVKSKERLKCKDSKSALCNAKYTENYNKNYKEDVVFECGAMKELVSKVPKSEYVDHSKITAEEDSTNKSRGEYKVSGKRFQPSQKPRHSRDRLCSPTKLNMRKVNDLKRKIPLKNRNKVFDVSNDELVVKPQRGGLLLAPANMMALVRKTSEKKQKRSACLNTISKKRHLREEVNVKEMETAASSTIEKKCDVIHSSEFKITDINGKKSTLVIDEVLNLKGKFKKPVLNERQESNLESNLSIENPAASKQNENNRGISQNLDEENPTVLKDIKTNLDTSEDLDTEKRVTRKKILPAKLRDSHITNKPEKRKTSAGALSIKARKKLQNFLPNSFINTEKAFKSLISKSECTAIRQRYRAQLAGKPSTSLCASETDAVAALRWNTFPATLPACEADFEGFPPNAGERGSSAQKIIIVRQLAAAVAAAAADDAADTGHDDTIDDDTNDTAAASATTDGDAVIADATAASAAATSSPLLRSVVSQINIWGHQQLEEPSDQGRRGQENRPSTPSLEVYCAEEFTLQKQKTCPLENSKMRCDGIIIAEDVHRKQLSSVNTCGNRTNVSELNGVTSMFGALGSKVKNKRNNYLTSSSIESPSSDKLRVLKENGGPNHVDQRSLNTHDIKIELHRICNYRSRINLPEDEAPVVPKRTSGSLQNKVKSDFEDSLRRPVNPKMKKKITELDPVVNEREQKSISQGSVQRATRSRRSHPNTPLAYTLNNLSTLNAKVRKSLRKPKVKKLDKDFVNWFEIEETRPVRRRRLKPDLLHQLSFKQYFSKSLGLIARSEDVLRADEADKTQDVLQDTLFTPRNDTPFIPTQKDHEQPEFSVDDQDNLTLNIRPRPEKQSCRYRIYIPRVKNRTECASSSFTEVYFSNPDSSLSGIGKQSCLSSSPGRQKKEARSSGVSDEESLHQKYVPPLKSFPSPFKTLVSQVSVSSELDFRSATIVKAFKSSNRVPRYSRLNSKNVSSRRVRPISNNKKLLTNLISSVSNYQNCDSNSGQTPVDRTANSGQTPVDRTANSGQTSVDNENGKLKAEWTSQILAGNKSDSPPEKNPSMKMKFKRAKLSLGTSSSLWEVVSKPKPGSIVPLRETRGMVITDASPADLSPMKLMFKRSDSSSPELGSSNLKPRVTKCKPISVVPLDGIKDLFPSDISTKRGNIKRKRNMSLCQTKSASENYVSELNTKSAQRNNIPIVAPRSKRRCSEIKDVGQHKKVNAIKKNKTLPSKKSSDSSQQCSQSMEIEAAEDGPNYGKHSPTEPNRSCWIEPEAARLFGMRLPNNASPRETYTIRDNKLEKIYDVREAIIEPLGDECLVLYSDYGGKIPSHVANPSGVKEEEEEEATHWVSSMGVGKLSMVLDSDMNDAHQHFGNVDQVLEHLYRNEDPDSDYKEDQESEKSDEVGGSYLEDVDESSDQEWTNVEESGGQDSESVEENGDQYWEKLDVNEDQNFKNVECVYQDREYEEENGEQDLECEEENGEQDLECEEENGEQDLEREEENLEYQEEENGEQDLECEENGDEDWECEEENGNQDLECEDEDEDSKSVENGDQDSGRTVNENARSIWKNLKNTTLGYCQNLDNFDHASGNLNPKPNELLSDDTRETLPLNNYEFLGFASIEICEEDSLDASFSDLDVSVGGTCHEEKRKTHSRKKSERANQVNKVKGDNEKEENARECSLSQLSVGEQIINEAEGLKNSEEGMTTTTGLPNSKGNHGSKRRRHSQKRVMLYCPQCDYRNKSKSYMAIHLTTHGITAEIMANHTADLSSKFLCQMCSFNTDNASAFGMHRGHHSMDISLFQPINKLQCNFCTFTTYSKKEYLKHNIDVHSSDTDVQTCKEASSCGGQVAVNGINEIATNSIGNYEIDGNTETGDVSTRGAIEMEKKNARVNEESSLNEKEIRENVSHDPVGRDPAEFSKHDNEMEEKSECETGEDFRLQNETRDNVWQCPVQRSDPPESDQDSYESDLDVPHRLIIDEVKEEQDSSCDYDQVDESNEVDDVVGKLQTLLDEIESSESLSASQNSCYSRGNCSEMTSERFKASESIEERANSRASGINIALEMLSEKATDSCEDESQESRPSSQSSCVNEQRYNFTQYNYCIKCPFKSRGVSSFAIHESLHEGFSNNTGGLLIHCVSPHETIDPKQLQFKCPGCRYATNVKTSFAVHMHRHQAMTIKVMCSFCPESFDGLDEIIRHVADAHTTSFRCRHCSNFCTTDAQSFIDHSSSHHKQTKRLSCPLCSFQAIKNSDSFQDHIITQHRTTKKNLFSCPFCSFKTAVLDGFKMHVKSHETKHYKCDECDYTSRYESYFKQHRETHNVDAILRCTQPDCAFTTVRKELLREHLASHAQHSGYRCDSCDLTFETDSELAFHAAVHAIDGLIKCPQCSYSGTNLNNYKKHTNQHTGKGIRLCQVEGCGYSCFRNSYLWNHIANKHTPLVHR